MSEAAFPLVGTLLIFGILLPAASVASKGILWLLARLDGRGLHRFGGLRYALLVLPTAVPLAWAVSASIHQAETGASSQVCAVAHGPSEYCAEAALLAVGLVLIVALAALPRILREQLALRPSGSAGASAARARVLAIISNGDTTLRRLSRAVVIKDDASEPIATFGVISPRVVLSTGFVQKLDDGALRAALAHEAEHVRGRDPLRYFIAWWALAANPLGGWLLRAELARWILAREAHCDRDAVVSGAGPSALAHALLIAARFGLPVPQAAALGATSTEILRLRVDLLMAYAERRPTHCCREPALRLTALAILVAAVLPHQANAVSALDALHTAAEQAVAIFHED